MRRADRLFTLLMHLRQRRAVTARELAERTGVSERTVYRDIRDLSLSGVPIDGAAGVGYRLRPGFEVPPLMFTREELTALRLGGQMVRNWADPSLASAASSALDKIHAALRGTDAEAIAAAPETLLVPGFFISEEMRRNLGSLRTAVESRQRVRLLYESPNASQTERIVQPLGLLYWGGSWTLAAWCELRQGFRSFRPDRIRALTRLESTFREDPARNLQAWIRQASES